MIFKYLIPLLAIAGVALAVYTVQSGSRPPQVAAPVAPPATSPFPTKVAGAGIVEAATENIELGTPIPGVITRIYVKVGDRVERGAPLLTIDDRAARAELDVRKAALLSAKAALSRLESMPRAEDIPPAQAKVREAEASLNDLKSQLQLWESIDDQRAIAKEDLSKRRYAVEMAEARYTQAKGELDLLKAGAWTSDIDIARAEVASAQALLDAAQTELDRLTVRAPVDCQILQVKARPGEYAVAGQTTPPLMLVGDTTRLHIRVDVDENDAWRIRPDAPAEGALRGNSSMKTPLTFVRIEPYVLPKRSLTGESTERVDTRVLQVIYSFDPKSIPVYVGQQMDVSIEAPPPGNHSRGKEPNGEA
ncbi:MAG: HlyD family efflux transporter periplasmic adaptor subunit [Phycisphaeraceae bacterium]|nr:HlyD family efflux transporter periplasmic adaptor subunit [Phycisphaeraceae bacterium]